jgi:hypothetical protein
MDQWTSRKLGQQTKHKCYDVDHSLCYDVDFGRPIRPLALLSKLSPIRDGHFIVQECGRRRRSMPAMRASSVATALESCNASSMASGQTGRRADAVEQGDHQRPPFRSNLCQQWEVQDIIIGKLAPHLGCEVVGVDSGVMPD